MRAWGEGRCGLGGEGGGGGRGNLQMSSNGGLPTHSQPMGGQQQQGQMLLANQDQYLSARAEALQNVERTITELGGEP